VGERREVATIANDLSDGALLAKLADFGKTKREVGPPALQLGLLG